MVTLNTAKDVDVKASKPKVSFAGDLEAQEDQNHTTSCCTACVRTGHAAAQGRRRAMEDSAFLSSDLSSALTQPGPPLTALLAVFDGHHGAHAADFASARILEGITCSKHFPDNIGAALAEAFLQIDQQYYAAVSGQLGESAGTTALAALVWGSTIYVANAGDSRAVISRSGRAIDLTRDHKPHEPGELQRITAVGGYVCEGGLLCGELGVARAIGDFHLPQLKPAHGEAGPLTAEPEVTQHELTERDEFMLLGCDGLWDVLPSQRAVELARDSLRQHNDPQLCAQALVDEALARNSSDNVTVICCCFGDEPPRRRVYGSGIGRSVSRDGLNSLAALLGQQL